jgi:hypothetical protein
LTVAQKNAHKYSHNEKKKEKQTFLCAVTKPVSPRAEAGVTASRAWHFKHPENEHRVFRGS